MNKKSGRAPVINVGTSLLLIVFIILCLAVFAALSVSTAKTDLSFSSKQAERLSMYYEANNEAEAVVADIDKMLGSQEADVLEERIESYFAENAIEGEASIEDDILKVSFSIEMSDSQALNVGMKIPEGIGKYSISSWEIISTAEWESHENTGFIQLQ